jgi:methionyl-tRNA formyltransferase
MRRKIILMASQEIGVSVAKYLHKEGLDEISALYLSGEDVELDQRLIQAAAIAPDRVFSPDCLKDPAHLAWLKAEGCDFVISIYWPHFIRNDVLDLVGQHSVNFHPALLPFNRGSFPHLFVLLENSPCGVTLHQVTSKLDAGPIWAQKEVAVLPEDTGGSLYWRLQKEILSLFKEKWPVIRMGQIKPVEQDESKASSHRASEIRKHNVIDLDKTYTGREWMNLLRSRSIGRYGFAYFEEAGKTIYANLRLGLDEDFLT